MKRYAASLAILLAPFVAHSAPQYDYMGAGTSSCGAWLQFREGRRAKDVAATGGELMAISWVQGFQAGVQLIRHGLDLRRTPPSDGATIRAYLDKHCRDHPLNTVMDAAVQMQLDLDDRTR